MKKEILDYTQIRTELIRAIRGKYSQERVSQKMGFRSNPVYRWENKLSLVDWQFFLKLCKVTNRDITKALRYILGYNGDPLDNAELLYHIFGTKKISEISKKTQVSRYMVANWIRGKSPMDLDFILRVLHEFQFILIEFIEVLVPMEKIPSLKPVSDILSEQKNAIYDHPEVEAVLCALTLNFYQNLKAHERGVIAKKIGISIEQEDRAIEILKRIGLIFEIGKKLRVPTTQLDTQGSFAGAVRIRKYWAQIYENYLNRVAPPEGTQSKTGYFLIDLSEEGEQQVLEAYLDFCFRLRAIAKQDHGTKKTVKYCSALLLDLPEYAKLSVSTE